MTINEFNFLRHVQFGIFNLLIHKMNNEYKYWNMNNGNVKYERI